MPAFTIRANDRGADLISTSRYTPASGCEEKAGPPKLHNGCRCFAAGAALNKCSTVTCICGGLSAAFYLFVPEK